MHEADIKGMVETLKERTRQWERKRQVYSVRSEQEFVIRVRPILPETNIRLSCPDQHGMRGARIEIQGYRWRYDNWEFVARPYNPLRAGYRFGVNYRFVIGNPPAMERRKAPPIKIFIRGAPYGSRVFVYTH